MPPRKKKTSVKKKKQKRAFPRAACMRACIAGSITLALVFLSSIATHTFSTLRGEVTYLSVQRVATIGLEYVGHIDMQIDISRSNTKGYAIIHGDPLQSIKISLPSSWHRTEVSGVPLKDVAAEPPSFGFTRWILPPKASMSLRIPDVPDMLSLQTPSPERATVTLHAIDVQGSTIEPQTILLQKKSVVYLWEE